jgi:hypothetical protein
MLIDNVEREGLATWSDVEARFREFSTSDSQWIFRGHSDARWSLESTLERAVADIWGDQAKLSSGSRKRLEALRDVLKNGVDGQDMWKVERRLLREFRRQYHLFSGHVPDAGDVMEWLSLMRHYGAPCRLVDFSYSWFVGLFFALVDSNKEAEVWAVDSDWAGDIVRVLLDPYPLDILDRDPQLRRPETADALLWSPTTVKRGVIPLNPYRLNPRLVIQQGIFLCPIEGSLPFMDNLDAMLGIPDPKCRKGLRRFTIPADTAIRREFLSRLSRMNMTQATLFPGLDGFAESLKIHLVNARFFERSGDFHQGRWM